MASVFEGNIHQNFDGIGAYNTNQVMLIMSTVQKQLGLYNRNNYYSQNRFFSIVMATGRQQVSYLCLWDTINHAIAPFFLYLLLFSGTVKSGEPKMARAAL